MQCVAVPTVDIAERGITDVDGLLQHGLEQRVQIAGRATDDLQHFRRSRLLLKDSAQFTRAVARSLSQRRLGWRSS